MRDNPRIARIAPALVEALVALGDLSAARAVSADFERWAAADQSAWGRACAARCRALVAEPEQSLRLFREALPPTLPVSDPFEGAKTMLAYAQRMAALDRADDAATLAGLAAEEFRELGLPAWARTVEERSAAWALPAGASAPGPDPGATRAAGPGRRAGQPASHGRDPAAPGANPPTAAPLLLTADERRVAGLVAEGLRNKQIAARLQVSVRTVESRLTAIYRRTGLTTRGELSQAIREGDLGA